MGWKGWFEMPVIADVADSSRQNDGRRWSVDG
jgi:hypothetical protein